MPREILGPGGQLRFVAVDRPAVAPAGIAVPGAQVEVLPGTAFVPEATRWLWPGWLARGKLHLLAGAPGTGKTTIALALAAGLSQGAAWPDGAAGAAGRVLIWSGEDGIEDTLLPRLLAAGGIAERVHFVTGARVQGRVRAFDPATDLDGLAEAAGQLAGLRLVILDPVVSAVSGDSHKNSETRRGLQPVVDLAARLDCAVLGITHLSKNTAGREPLERVTGSIAFGAVARVVLATVRPADPAAPRRLIRAKSNLGPDSDGVEYRLFSAPLPGHDFGAQRVAWGAPLSGSARDLMAVEQDDGRGPAQRQAIDFLRRMLADGPVATRALRDAAQAHGQAWRTVELAKNALGVRAVRHGFGGGATWAWTLPPKTAADAEDRKLREGCGLRLPLRPSPDGGNDGALPPAAGGAMTEPSSNRG